MFAAIAVAASDVRMPIRERFVAVELRARPSHAVVGIGDTAAPARM